MESHMYNIFPESVGALGFEPIGRDAPYEVIHHDNLESVLGLSGHDGTVLQTISYDPFGNTISTSGNSNNNQLHYTGREQDPDTGLYNYRRRTYDPSTGTFTTEDPRGILSKIYNHNHNILINQNVSSMINAYIYADDNPVNFNDPYGLDVTITIYRNTYTNQSITGKFNAVSDVTGNSYSGVTLENAKAGVDHTKPPIPSGYYDAFLRTKYDPNRIQLENVPGYDGSQPGYVGIQMHIGNTPKDLEGCFAVGTEQNSPDSIQGSRAALIGLDNVIKGDNTGKISVQLYNGSEGSFNDNSFVGSTAGANAAAGGYLLYPNKPNNNHTIGVYSK